jgi:hypothetical protein
MTTLLAAWLTLAPLAQKAPNPADVKPGWLGFAMFLALAVATVLLWLSFRKQLKRIDFDEDAPTRPGDPRHDDGASGA